MNVLQRILQTFRSMFARSASRNQPPIPLFRDRETFCESITTGAASYPVADRPTFVCHIEFIGGPLDGYQEELRQENLAETLAIPITAFALAALAGSKVVNPRREPTSIAIYELDSPFDAPIRYRFQGAAAPQQVYRDVDI